MPDKISLIIPVRNEGSSVARLLESIAEQSLKPEEIVISDGGSTDETAAVIESYIKKGLPIRLLTVGMAYPGKARNLAIEASDYDLIAMTDAGIRLSKNWLENLCRRMEEDDSVDVVYGSYDPVRDSFFKQCLAVAFVPAPKVINGRKIRSHFIASSMIRKKVWEAVGGFPDFRAAEDRIFMDRIGKAGFKIAYAPDAVVYWDIPSDFLSVFRRFSLYSMHDIRAEKWRDWHYPVSMMYLMGLIIALLGIFNSPLWFILLLAGVLLRTLGLIFERAEGIPLLEKLSIRRILLITMITIWIDIAMFWGSARYFAAKFLK